MGRTPCQRRMERAGAEKKIQSTTQDEPAKRREIRTKVSPAKRLKTDKLDLHNNENDRDAYHLADRESILRQAVGESMCEARMCYIGGVWYVSLEEDED